MRRATVVVLGLVFLGCLGLSRPGYARTYTAVSFVDARTGYIAGGDRLLRSTDGGQTWSVLIRPGSAEGVKNVRRLRFRDSSLGWFVDDDTDRVFLTTDGGRTWSPRPLRIHIGAGVTGVDFFEFASPTVAWGGGRRGGGCLVLR